VSPGLGGRPDDGAGVIVDAFQHRRVDHRVDHRCDAVEQADLGVGGDLVGREVAAQGAACEYLLSVCTGALVLACAGLLDGLAATTHHLAFNELRAVAPHTAIREGARIVDNGRVILSSGVSAGIDMSLHVVARLLGEDLALETARYMEYEGDWHRT